MNPSIEKQFAEQLATVTAECERVFASMKYDDGSDLRDIEAQRLTTTCRAAIERIAGEQSTYGRQTQEILRSGGGTCAWSAMQLLGVVKALHNDMTKGYLASFQQLIHAEVFSDLLEQAEHLLAERYKGPAAVVAGCVLEDTLRKLCDKLTPPSTTLSKDRTSLNEMNGELAKRGVYNKLRLKEVTAWADIRNNAAHGKWNEFGDDDVKRMIAGVRGFVIENPVP